MASHLYNPPTFTNPPVFPQSWPLDGEDWASQLFEVGNMAPCQHPQSHQTFPMTQYNYSAPQYPHHHHQQPMPQACEAVRQPSPHVKTSPTYPIGSQEPKRSQKTTKRQFAHRIDRFFVTAGEQTFHCVVCEADATIHFDGKNLTVSCGHYQCCNECRARLARQLLRCSTCSKEILGEYPVCGDQCELVSEKLSQGLSTTGCPRCNQKLSKEICGSSCTRVKSKEYQKGRKKLLKVTATMVLKPGLCENLSHLGERPCSHFTKCSAHGKITQGRANQPRCPTCRESARKTSRADTHRGSILSWN